MKHLNWHCYAMTLLIGLACLGIVGGCETGEQVIDEMTGNRAVKQYHKSKKNIEKAAQKQAKKYKRFERDAEDYED